MPFAVKTLEAAMPFASVTSVSVAVPFEKVPLAELVGALNVTVAPVTGFEKLSSTAATSGEEKVVPIAAFCDVPLVAVMVAGGPARFVRVNVAGVDTPATVAATLSEPANAFAVNVVEVATPFTSVVTLVAFVPVSANVALAPLAEALNITIANCTGF